MLRRTLHGLRLPLAATLALTTAGQVHAYEASVDASSSAQFYTLQSPYGDPLVRRRRYTQLLGLNLYDITGSRGEGPELTFRARMRLDSDFGIDPAELDSTRRDRFIPGLEQSPLDLMYAYVDGRGYFGGLFGFRLGRQYTSDALGFWSFDGAQVELTTPLFVRLQLLGGFEQRSGLPLSTARWEAQGVYRGDRSGLDPSVWPGFLTQQRLAPAYGAALESTGLHWLSARLSYRKVITRDRVVVAPFADAAGRFQTIAGDRVASERVGSALRLSAGTLGALNGSVVYDLYNRTFSEYLASASWYASEQLTLGAEYEYYLPTFDADAIWNWFSHRGMTTVRTRGAFLLTDRHELAASFGVRTFRTHAGTGDSEPATEAGEQAALSDWLLTLRERYGWASGSVTVNGSGEIGERGHHAGADVIGRQTFDGGFYDALVILSLYDWRDKLRARQDTTSFSYVLGGGVSPTDNARFGLEWEHSTNELVGQRYRVLATLDLTVLQ